MPISELLLQGANLMLLGMGIVFTFLAILVLTMTWMSKLARSLEKEEVHGTTITTPARVDSGADKNEELVAVIAAAVSRYRSR